MQHTPGNKESLEAAEVELAAEWTERKVCNQHTVEIRENRWAHLQLLAKPQEARWKRFTK